VAQYATWVPANNSQTSWGILCAQTCEESSSFSAGFAAPHGAGCAASQDDCSAVTDRCAGVSFVTDLLPALSVAAPASRGSAAASSTARRFKAATSSWDPESFRSTFSMSTPLLLEKCAATLAAWKCRLTPQMLAARAVPHCLGHNATTKAMRRRQDHDIGHLWRSIFECDHSLCQTGDAVDCNVRAVHVKR
jgi:hypothetical protein